LGVALLVVFAPIGDPEYKMFGLTRGIFLTANLVSTALAALVGSSTLAEVV
jgi:hypothetical protein